MIGYAFMGAAHSQGWRTAPRVFDLPLTPEMALRASVTFSGNDATSGTGVGISLAINPPGRGVPKETGASRKFAEDYIRFMRAHNVNMIRLEPESDVWFEVADELASTLVPAARTSRSPGVHEVIRYGPVPTGFWLKADLLTS